MPRRKKVIRFVEIEPFPPVLGWRERIVGEAYKLGDRIDCDSIIPVRFCTRPGLGVYRKHCLTIVDPDFPEKSRQGLIILAGGEFGRGSANENAVWALASCGVRAVVAVTFASTFRRNALNLGFFALTCPPLVKESEVGDQIEIDLLEWQAHNHTQGFTFPLEELTPLEGDILRAGGLIPYLNNLKGETTPPGKPPCALMFANARSRKRSPDKENFPA
ncbi:MAG: 3-isopropylmalate dehydratase small subunit [bacterium]